MRGLDPRIHAVRPHSPLPYPPPLAGEGAKREGAWIVGSSPGITKKARPCVPLYAHADQNNVPNHLLANEPLLSTQEIGGSCGR